jgi:hypothetical protein
MKSRRVGLLTAFNAVANSQYHLAIAGGYGVLFNAVANSQYHLAVVGGYGVSPKAKPESSDYVPTRYRKVVLTVLPLSWAVGHRSKQ